MILAEVEHLDEKIMMTNIALDRIMSLMRSGACIQKVNGCKLLS